MADVNVRNPAVNRIGTMLPTQTIDATAAGQLRDIPSLRTYLKANGYTDAQLQLMSENDMLYAWRVKTNRQYK